MDVASFGTRVLDSTYDLRKGSSINRVRGSDDVDKLATLSVVGELDNSQSGTAPLGRMRGGNRRRTPETNFPTKSGEGSFKTKLISSVTLPTWQDKDRRFWGLWVSLNVRLSTSNHM